MTFLNSNSKSFKNPPTDQHCCFDYNENEGLLLPKGKHTYKDRRASNRTFRYFSDFTDLLGCNFIHKINNSPDFLAAA